MSEIMDKAPVHIRFDSRGMIAVDLIVASIKTSIKYGVCRGGGYSGMQAPLSHSRSK